MHGNETTIKSQHNVLHRFFFDHCFWSMDDQRPELYASQEKVYTELARPLLDRSL